MTISLTDPIYGAFEVNEPVVAELLACPALSRLAGVDQGGYMRAHFPGAEHSRLEHSVGVFLLLRLFGAGLEEQVSGLLHDASHTVFSHAVDYALENGSGARQDFQDLSHREYVLGSELPEILTRHGFDVNRVIDEENFSLLETKLPDICADRIDYMLRTAVHVGAVRALEAAGIIATLRAEQGRWIFSDVQAARVFAELFAFINHTYLSGFPSAVMFRTVGDALRYALESGAVEKRELFTTDEQAINKMRQLAENDEQMMLLWQRMNLKSPVLPDFSETPEATVVLKSRMVDPWCRNGFGQVLRLSDAWPEWGERVRAESRPKTLGLCFA